MTIWVPRPDLDSDEQVRLKAPAQTFRGQRRYISGQLIVTDKRLIFTPNRLDGLTGAQRRIINLSDVRDIQQRRPRLREGVQQIGIGLTKPFLRPQIEIDDGTGGNLIVALADPDKLIELLRP